MKHILRYHIRECLANERIADLEKYCERTGCRELLLFTGSYDFQPSFVSLEDLKSYAASMAIWMEEFNKSGIAVNINVLQTLGHVNFPLSDSRQFPFQRRVDWAGNEGGGGACPLDKELSEYVVEIYRTFAVLKPSVIYVDDDFRSHIGGLCCFCDEHLKRIGEILGRAISRSDLCTEMLKTNSTEPNTFRRAFHQAQVDGLCQLSESIRKNVAEVSPNTRLGLMIARIPLGLWGHDFLAVGRALAGKKRKPLLRPQIVPYKEDVDLHSCAGSFRQPAIVREIYNHEADIQPEIENYTFTTYAKSSQLTFLQMITNQMDGCHEALLNIFDFYGSPFSQSEPIVKMLEQNKGLFMELADLIPEGHRSGGIALWQHAEGHLHYKPRRKITDLGGLLPERNAEQYISLLGMPVGFQWQESPFLLLSGDDVAALDETQLTAMLERNAILDLPALERIIEKGFGDMVGVKLGQAITAEQSTAELFVDERFCGQHVNKYSPLRVLVSDNWCRSVSPCTDISFKPLSWVVNHKNEKICPVVSAVETSAGRRFGILGFGLNGVSRHMFVHERRCIQMKNLFEWVARDKLPVITSNHAFLVPQYTSLPDGDVVIALSNYSLDKTDEPLLEMNFSSIKSVKRLTAEGKWKEADADFEKRGPTTFVLIRPVNAFEIVIYRLTNQQ